MKKIDIALTGLVILAALAGCTFPSGTQTLLPTLVLVPSPTFYLATGTWVGSTPTVDTAILPASATPSPILPTATLNLPTPTPSGSHPHLCTQPDPGEHSHTPNRDRPRHVQWTLRCDQDHTG